MLLGVSAALVVVLFACWAGYWWSFGPLRRRRGVVQLDDGTAFDGVLLARRGPLLVLADVSLRMPGVDAKPLDGQIVVERSRVVFVQVM